MRINVSRWREFFGGLIAFTFCALAAFYFYQTVTGDYPWGTSVLALAHLVVGIIFYSTLGNFNLEVNQDVDPALEKTDS